MKMQCAPTHWAPLLALLFATPLAFAQPIYRCGTGAGSYVSDRPCRDITAPTVLRSYGPLPERPNHGQSYTPTMAKAPDILPYLSPQCAEMNDAVRTGPSRGLQSAAMSELVANYRLRCAEDEQQAYQKLHQVRNDERNQRRIAQAQQSAAQERAKLSVEQCSEMLRILAGRRQRVASMSAGEKTDLDLFEANYRARCKSG